jgi:hypothetical protein
MITDRSKSVRLRSTSFFALSFAVGVIAAIAPYWCAAQVFVVGEKSATAGIDTSFSPTHVPLSDAGMTERNMRELVRNLEGEQGFAHRPLPLGAALVLEANGTVKPTPDAYRKLIYEKGQAAAAGDRVAITGLEVRPDRILIDLNGGPNPKHRWLRHLSIDDMPVVAQQRDALGSRITLTFEGGTPAISASEIKALLEPLIDFGVKSSEVAYSETLPRPVKEAIASHEVLVGMNHRMVLAALGAPESKMREHDDNDPNGPRYEEWIYGHVPQTVKFVRFEGDRVSMVKIAAVGKPVDIHRQDELSGYLPPAPVREIALGDSKIGDPDHRPVAPTLRRPGDEPTPGQNNGAVQMPKEKVQPIPAVPGSPADSTATTPDDHAVPSLAGRTPPSQVSGVPQASDSGQLTGH